MFISNTVEDLLKNKRGNTEIIVVLDSKWADPPIAQHPDVQVIYVPTAIGQRAATNIGVKLSKAKYVAKVDAHCSFDEGFDVKMIEAFKQAGDNCIIVPVMRNLHAFDWKCYSCGWKKYQGPKPKECERCKRSDKIRRKIVWQPRRGTYSTSYAFDSQPHFSYFPEYKHRPEYIKGKAEGLTETMSLQGSFFMATRENYWNLKLSDEAVGSWGNQGIELACKMWLSGGRVLINHKTWYAHMFRTQNDFSFPYDHINSVDSTKKRVWEHFFNGKFKQQIHPVSWLVEKFWPIPPGTPDDKRNNIGWTSEALAVLKKTEKMI